MFMKNVWKMNKPECQIYWSIFSQKHQNNIKEIKWTDIKNIKRIDPIKK